MKSYRKISAATVAVKLLVMVSLAGTGQSVFAQEPRCRTIQECANEMVEMVGALREANRLLENRLIELERELKARDEQMLEQAKKYVHLGIENLAAVGLELNDGQPCPKGSVIVAIPFQFIRGNDGPIGNMQPYCGKLGIVP